jgi:hypothetical protein
MNFAEHSKLKGCHAFLGASSYHWLNYTDDKLITTYSNLLAKQRGTELHEFAAKAIELGIKLPRSNKTLNMYVNDAIGFRMSPEVVLFYSENCFGTADAISFRDNVLRIHDLKTGVSPVKMEQLMIYAALFCLEYRYEPSAISIKLRIYQNDDYEEFEPTAEDLVPIMNKIKTFDKLIDDMKYEEA